MLFSTCVGGACFCCSSFGLHVRGRSSTEAGDFCHKCCPLHSMLLQRIQRVKSTACTLP